ncbi:hypothetical protein TCSYLVIO_001891 [Trypanosoma cruzi]|uniref:Uncharacterized protein n=1 Tax=Trypanosoma cruzi TaxID=5693 RepID=A0A2V2V1S1_TRYCR|nr:hypothetical protein TCSYLVIO_001891 [Trypanosoma cruzi]PBJ77162.1 hypothetical protein BCY84_07012 [Trypanosoma cruzi cruzi]PWU90557.1 hypothetical protein C4B63_49g168 [Trypanosoma cruzi]RNF15934.1 hypothetical protein TcG_06728 [Trypanosoma cruzi]
MEPEPEKRCDWTIASSNWRQESLNNSLRRNRKWLGRRPTSSIHPFHRDSLSVYNCKSPNDNNGSWANNGILVPSPIRPQMCATPALICKPPSTLQFTLTGATMKDVTNTRSPSTSGKVAAAASAASRVSSSNNFVNIQSTFQTISRSGLIAPVDNSAASDGVFIARYTAGAQGEESFLDNQGMNEFFSGSWDFWRSNVSESECHLIKGSSCPNDDSVIDFDVAMSFQRSGARRCRKTGPGFDAVPLEPCLYRLAP